MKKSEKARITVDLGKPLYKKLVAEVRRRRRAVTTIPKPTVSSLVRDLLEQGLR